MGGGYFFGGVVKEMGEGWCFVFVFVVVVFVFVFVFEWRRRMNMGWNFYCIFQQNVLKKN